MFDMSAFMGKFIEEAKERLQKLNDGILLLESQPDDKEAIKGIMREAHTLKGSSKMMGLLDVNRVAHIMEDLMVAISDGRVAVNSSIVDTLFAACDMLTALVEKAAANDDKAIDTEPVCRMLSDALEGKVVDTSKGVGTPAATTTETKTEAASPAPDSAPTPDQPVPSEAPASAPPAAKKAPEETVRVGLEKIDHMASLTAELITDSIRAVDFGKTINDLFKRLEKQRKEHSLNRLNADDLLATIVPVLQDLSDRHGSFSLHLSQVVDDLRDHVMGIRMLPLSTVFDTYPRAIRNLSRELGKKIEFIVEGGETSLDKRVIEAIGDPLIHLVRNSVDHGVESPEQRIAAGKAEKGTVRLSAVQRGDRIIIQLEDDGKGIDPAGIRSAAVRKNFLSEADAMKLSDIDAINLIFMPGFSSKTAVTDVSGRGVGMDVVKTTAEKLGGMVSVTSELGKGSRFTVELPLTVALLKVLLVGCSGHTFAIPVSSIEQIISLRRSDVFSVEGAEMFYHANHAVPLKYLSNVLEIPCTTEAADSSTVLIIRGENEKKAGLMVDTVGDDEEIVIKELGNYLGKVQKVSAATIMPDGRIVMIVDIPEIFRSASRAGALSARPETTAVETQPRTKRVILVAEDSLLVRELERDVLKAAGYEVVTAIDGKDAREKIEKQEFDLVLTDIEMPRMDGLELTRQVRADDRLKEIPVIVMSSLDSPDTKRQGMDAGADAYIVKKEFDQQDLLDTVKRLIR
ncbi:MAG: hybrid sensor histidine kinase/response regulator [Nitrospirota bacterium]|nr:hybrid sensor histidine kinase/response regulator [Nitrospirota bacterium]